MKNVILVFALVLCTCTLDANAQAPPVPGAGIGKAAFLASLGMPTPVATSARSGRGLPTKSTCTVTLTCDVGAYPLSCSSSVGDCQAGSTWVKCDGAQQYCPICYKSVSCACPEGQIYECWGWSSCSHNLGMNASVTCDGETYGSCLPAYECGP